jgi:hypothetical protein
MHQGGGEMEMWRPWSIDHWIFSVDIKCMNYFLFWTFHIWTRALHIFKRRLREEGSSEGTREADTKEKSGWGPDGRAGIDTPKSRRHRCEAWDERRMVQILDEYFSGVFLHLQGP